MDSGLFYIIAFAGSWTTVDVVTVSATQYVLKSGWEIIMTPVTYRIVGFLKRSEQEDYFDRDTDFTPFSLSVGESRISRAFARADDEPPGAVRDDTRSGMSVPASARTRPTMGRAK